MLNEAVPMLNEDPLPSSETVKRGFKDWQHQNDMLQNVTGQRRFEEVFSFSSSCSTMECETALYVYKELLLYGP